MARQWGERSSRVLNELDPRLQQVMTFILITIADVSLICGHRTEEEQNEAFAKGNSKLRWPKSAHNSTPARAVDFQPYPMPNIHATDPAKRAKARRKLWGSLGYIAGAARVYAFANGFRLRWGGDWDGDGDLTDQNFDDLFHIELVDE
jgi:peptidoglycan L-alanyl-D-glutamate endopeptidase CwlK